MLYLGRADSLRGVLMSDTTEEFFDRLARHGAERLLRKTTGTIRFDLAHEHGDDHWFVTIRNGQVRVSREESDADCVIHAENAVFDRMVLGEVKPLPAWLRNDITTEGEYWPIVLLERLFRQPPGAHHPREFVREHRGRR
ncbi:SCP-2 sterol transfer family protein [Micromonospora echinaurantiaca]|uniref:SCP-2 sterol transfer family protein n=1 Tax=Micromonospora echinaurantiaca TaxID=47857 RepID=A0A1C5HNE3_9ACTN|nr:SCP2 sterol-binding domain-containing protein [Micromonospora echinaurantiaca]SCG47433.1 SCP-2 sterol transfer family protein [Micromonospora echinaurantiaca]